MPATQQPAGGPGDGAANGSAASAGRAGARMALLALGGAGVLIGTAVQLQLRELPAAHDAAATFAAALLLMALAAWPRGSRAPSNHRATAVALQAALVLVGMGLFAFALTSWRAQARLDERLPAVLEGLDIEVTGIVAQLPRAGLQGTRFLFKVESATLPAELQRGPQGHAPALPPLLSLGWYRGAEADALLLGPATDVRAGQRWRFTVRLRQPHGPFNPGGFDLELWLFERGIGATGYVRSRAGDTAQLLAESAGAPVERLRQQVRDAIEQRITDPARAGVIAALAIGDQAAIEREDWDLFRITGVAHLMSISGLHVTMFAWLAGGVLGWLWRRSPRAVLALPAPWVARWGGVAVAAAYALVAGWGVPAQRTVCMLATVALLQSLNRRWPLHLVLLAAATVVLMLDPWALLQPGFWLSFVAVGLLAASEPVLGRNADDDAGDDRARAAPAGGTPTGPRWLQRLQWLQWLQRTWTTLRTKLSGSVRSALRTQVTATIGLAPLTLVFFQQVSLVGFAANLLAIPAVTLLITPLALLGTLAPPLWHAASAAIGALMVALQWLAAWPQAVWQAAAAPAWAVAAGLFGGLLAILPLPWALRALALPLMLPLLAPVVTRPEVGRFEMVALDVGQGTAALIRTRHHLLVYDAGPAFTPEADAGSRLLVPLLRRRGEVEVDHLMLSHRDTDHVGGALSLLAALPVRLLSSSLAADHPILERAAAAARRRCEAGQRWQWDGVHFEVLHPVAADYEIPGQRPNALSCVLHVQGAHTSVLLTGDIEAAQEAALLARAAPRLRAQGLLVPHHGSRTSSTPAFIEAVGAPWALAQAGYRSRFGHPAPDIVARYESRSMALLRSDRCGALTLEAGGGKRCEREAARRYWHHRVDPGTPP